MSAARLSASLPKGEKNGLDGMAQDLLDRPDDVRIIVAAVRPKEIVTDVESGDRTVRLGIGALEVITSTEDREAVQRAMSAAFHERTGSSELPFDLDADADDADNDGGDA